MKLTITPATKKLSGSRCLDAAFAVDRTTIAMGQLIAQARPDILWADIYHTTGTVKNKTCILCK